MIEAKVRTMLVPHLPPPAFYSAESGKPVIMVETEEVPLYCITTLEDQ